MSVVVAFVILPTVCISIKVETTKLPCSNNTLLIARIIVVVVVFVLGASSLHVAAAKGYHKVMRYDLDSHFSNFLTIFSMFCCNACSVIGVGTRGGQGGL